MQGLHYFTQRKKRKTKNEPLSGNLEASQKQSKFPCDSETSTYDYQTCPLLLAGN
uniref:Uncharacterized protein n=1 Tax=Arundo donax TaxID=35708 RepID=A0A0A9AP26_ARUDO